MQFRHFIPTSVATLLVATGSEAQTTFSIEGHGPTITLPDAFTGTPITAGDILTPGTAAPGPNPPLLGAPVPPGTFLSAGAGGLGMAFHTVCIGVPAGVQCEVEVDALSYGQDFQLDKNLVSPGTFLFSVDEYAIGVPGAPAAPNVTSEGVASPGMEASADVFGDVGASFPPPWLPGAPAPANTAYIDGDGLPSATLATYAGLGLVEPNPLTGGPPDPGDNLDAVDVDSPDPAAGVLVFPVYFSMDSSYFDVAYGYPLSSTALVHGFSGADVLRTSGPTSAPAVWAPAALLGLDLFGADTDDLDALALWENGSGVFEPSQNVYDWLGGARDMLLFSVRRGSAVIGMPDSTFGIPIEEGDILTTPLAGGVSPFPSLFIAAETIGLATLRGGFPVNLGDDLDALDLVMVDCNLNGVSDGTDIAAGTSTDVNGNNVPDDCEIIASPYCYCPDATVAPCVNPDPLAGCLNSTGVGGLLSYSGTNSSVTTDNLVLTASQLPAFEFGIFFMGPVIITPFPFGDGLRCFGGGLTRFLPPTNTGAGGVSSLGPGIAAAGGITAPPAVVFNFQYWYRDPTGPCGSSFNLTNAVSVTWTP